MDNQERESSTPQDTEPVTKRRNGRELPPEQRRSEMVGVRMTPDLHAVIAKTAEAWELDESTLCFNILEHVIKKPRLTDEEVRAFARGRSVLRSFFRRPA